MCYIGNDPSRRVQGPASVSRPPPIHAGETKLAVATRDWETTLREWSKPSSDTEEAKCDRAERMIKLAITAYPGFAGVDIHVYAKGSYPNNTNVRLDSDVDVAVELRRSLYFDGTAVPGFTPGAVGIWTPAPDNFSDFKMDVHAALMTKFGARNVVRGNKAFDIHENTSRVDADVVPCWEYRYYYGIGRYDYHSGTALVADDGQFIVNWPAQQKANGTAKNIRTLGRYKWITRAVKRLRNEMADDGIPAAFRMSSFLIECLMYNVPDGYFGNSRYIDDVKNALAHIAMNADPQWLEVSELKWLFGPQQNWTVDEVKSFALAAFARLP